MLKIKFNYITLYFLLIAFLCGYIKNALIITLIVLFHELGHVFICFILKYKIVSVEIFPFGGITKINKHLNDSIIKDLLIAIFGIIFQLILFIFYSNPLVIKYNLAILLFNILPIIPLDGSKILFEILNAFFSYKKVLIIYSITSIIFIFFYILINYQYNINNYLIIMLFIYKTVEIIKQRKIIFNKFIVERMIYDLKYNKLSSNAKINNYKKDVKYYYKINNRIIDEKEYLHNKYKL